MPYFERSTDPIVQGSTLIDVRGDQYNIQVEAQFLTDEKTSELGIDALYQATVFEAFHNSRERAPPPKCHPETRKTILSEIMSWITSTDYISHDHKRVLWLYGPAGAGKSAIAQTISEFCAETKTLAASFFFARGKDRRSSAAYVFTTIAHQLATSNAHLRLAIGKAVAKNRAILEQCLDDQVRELIVDPLKLVQSATGTTALSHHKPFLIVMDSLDECHNDTDHCSILDYVAALVYTHSLPLTFLISSRPEPHIRHFFNEDPALSAVSRCIALESSPEDIQTFLRSGFHRIRQRYYLYTTALIPEDWPSEQDIETLVQRSSGYFIYAATALQFVNSVDTWPPDQLNLVLSGQSSPFAELDQLYHQILSMVANSKLLVRILGYILLLANGSHDEIDYHSPAVIGSLLNICTGDIRLTLRKMHPLLDVPATDEAGIQIIHASFSDFLFNHDRSGTFHVDSGKFRINLAHSCLKFMQQWTTPSADQRTIKFVFHNWVKYCHEATHLGDRIQIVEDLERVPDFLPDKNPQYNFQYREKKLREAVEWLSSMNDPPRHLVRLISNQRDLCYLICLSNYGSYHYLDRALTLPINVVFSPAEYLQERRQLSKEADTGTLEDFYLGLGGTFCAWKPFRTREYVNVDKELFKFLLDETRAREYFLGPKFFSTAHAKMFRSCIQTITQTLNAGNQIHDYEVPPRYSLNNWSKHLMRCSPNNLELLSYIEPNLLSEYASLTSASEVSQWLRSSNSPPPDLLAWWENSYRSLALQKDNCKELLEPQIWNTLDVDSMTVGDWKKLVAQIEALYLDDGDSAFDAEVDVGSGTDSESEVSSYLSNAESTSE